ncbi:MAG: DUF3795 domain-containing protein [bacterium]
MEGQVSTENSDSTSGKISEILEAICGLNCGDCQFYKDKCLGCPKQKGIMFWGRCPIFRCCVYEKGLESCAVCSQFLCQKFLDQITTSIGL